MDVLSKEQRSYNMSRIKGKNTKPEEIVRKLLWSNGYRYRLHYKKLPGKPDIVFPGKKKAIFVNGCFWHQHDCCYFKWPKTNEQFWRDKIGENVKRDYRNHSSLTELGWEFIVIWECEIKKLPEKELTEILNRFLK